MVKCPSSPAVTERIKLLTSNVERDAGNHDLKSTLHLNCSFPNLCKSLSCQSPELTPGVGPAYSP